MDAVYWWPMATGVLMRRRTQRGFTLIEVAIAISVLGVVAASLMSASARLTRSVTGDRTRTIAGAAVDAQLALARSWPNYATLSATYAGTSANTPLPGITRTTTVVRTGGVGQPNDYMRVTVSVAGTGLATPISRTITVAAP